MKKIIVILLVGITFSCSDDYLTVDPQATLFSSEYFSTLEEVEAALFSTYDVLGHQKGTNFAWAPPLILSEILSDDAIAGGQDAGDGAEEDEFNTFSFSTSNDIVRSLWKKNYFGVYRSNFTIEKAELLEEVDLDKLTRIIAEAKFLRAYFNFELVRFFENVPLFTEVATGIKDGNRPQVAPSLVYNQIAADLVDAIPNLSEIIGTGRATKWSAQALLARVYLFENGVYGSGLTANGTSIDGAYVLTQLEDLINNSGHDLLPIYSDIFSGSNEFSIESVFEISYGGAPVNGDWGSEQYVEGNLAAQMMGPRVTGSQIYYRGWAFGMLTEKLVNDLQGDPRFDATVLTEAALLSESGTTINTGSYQYTGYYNNKYTTKLVDRGIRGTPELHNTSNQRVIRFSDVLLMAAEIGQNVAYINRVRARVALPDVVAYSEDALLAERRLELSGEGLRYFDLLRQGVTVAASELNISGEYGQYYTGRAEIYDVQFNSTSRGFLPIPQVEIDLSGGKLLQNSGY